MESKERKEGASHKPKCCLGVLYFSSSRFEREKAPVCGGFSKRLRPTDDASQLPTDSIPGGAFKYACVGYSAWDEEGLKQAAQRRTSQTDAVQLPYCEGLEVVSSAAVHGRPELLTEGPGVRHPPRGSAVQDGQDPDAGQRPGRSFVPGIPGMGQPSSLDWDQFKERFDQVSKKIVIRMIQNASFMAATVKKSWEQIMKDVVGRGGGRERPG